jgi:putative ABC transport system permease protein
MASFVHDIRFGVRTLLRTPGFTVAALLTLALGIGANTAIFSVINGVLLRPLPYPESDRLVRLVRRHPAGVAENQTGLRYLFFREHVTSVDGMTAYSGAGSFNLVAGDRAQFVNALGVSKEYFAVFGVAPVLGQSFSAEHDGIGGPDVAILTHSLWRRQFAEDRGVVGRAILLGDTAYTVVGVMPATYESAGFDLLLPLRPSITGRGGGFNYTVVARLRPGVTIEQATSETSIAWQAYREQHPNAVMPNELPSAFVRLQESLASPVRPALMMMLGAVGLLLLIACANTASLLLARASARGREMAVRAALGAGRPRIVRQLLTESVLLALAGAALGVLFAYWTVPALLALTPPGFFATEGVRIDTTVLTATLVTALAAAVIFGLAPALSVTRHDLVEAFKADGGRATASRRSAWLRRGLVVAEVALCMLLLVGAGLLVQTFLNLRAVDPGFDPRQVLIAQMSMQGNRYARPEDVTRFYEEGLRRIRQLPGVRSAAVTSGLPIARALNLNVDVLDWPAERHDRAQNVLTDWRYVTPDYFETMRIPVVSGRGFTERDRIGAPRVAVVSEEFARRLFPGTSAVGRHVRVFDADGAMQIVGIVKDLKEGGLKGDPRLVMYVPAGQTHAAGLRTTHSYFPVNWVVRADDPGPQLRRQIEEQIRQVDSRQPFSGFRTMDEVKTSAMLTERFQMAVLGVFASIGLLLAAAGVYGLIAYSVAQRTREFGIRMALGATSGNVLFAVLRQGALLALAGVVAGAAAAALSTHVLRNFVWGVSTLDPVTFIAVAALLMAVAAMASVVPALKAVKANPVSALRE